jgi:mono/diheme cytochrome c family protein
MLLGVAMAGGRRSYMPSPETTSSLTPGDGTYPSRTDLMVVGKTGLDGAPKRWPSPAFPPLKSARVPAKTPDPDIAEEIRKQLGKNVLDPGTDLNPVQAAQLSQLLARTFGSPSEPTITLPTWNELMLTAVARPNPDKGAFETIGALASGLQKWDVKRWKSEWEAATAARSELKLDDLTLARGSVIYRRWCLQCHGPTGGGDGGQLIEFGPMPRDYRQGIFKYGRAFPQPGVQKKGPSPNGKPLKEDIQRVIHNGIDGTMMPAFPNLSEQELDDLASYVIHLSVRGETEFLTLAKAMQPTEDDPEFTGPELNWLFDQNLLAVLSNWELAAHSPIPIPPEHVTSDDERLISALRGYKHYNSAEFGCAACHINYGREPALKWDLWGTVVQPRNLTLGVYRGGRRGADLYSRIYGGIYPSGMTAFHPTLKTGPIYPDRPDKIWNIVHFLQALSDPYDRQRLKDPALLKRYKDQLKAEGDNSLDDLNGVKIDP